jgi:hypothetical protein
VTHGYNLSAPFWPSFVKFCSSELSRSQWRHVTNNFETQPQRAISTNTIVLPTAADVHAAHDLYCQLTGQNLRLRFDRERQWWELLKEGHTREDIRIVIAYLQREIRAGKRNVGALKLSNLLQPDRFEEDLEISRVLLRPPQKPSPPKPSAPKIDPVEAERSRQKAIEGLRQFRVSQGWERNKE